MQNSKGKENTKYSVVQPMWPTSTGERRSISLLIIQDQDTSMLQQESSLDFLSELKPKIPQSFTSHTLNISLLISQSFPFEMILTRLQNCTYTRIYNEFSLIINTRSDPYLENYIPLILSSLTTS